MTIGLVGLYGLYRAATERAGRRACAPWGWRSSWSALGVLLSAVQWVPSKELLDRSPRAGGLSYGELTYASWHPELLPTLVVREAYGTRAARHRLDERLLPLPRDERIHGPDRDRAGGRRRRGRVDARSLGELLGLADRSRAAF